MSTMNVWVIGYPENVLIFLGTSNGKNEIGFDFLHFSQSPSIYPDVYLGPYKISMMDIVCKLVNSGKAVTIFANTGCICLICLTGC